jgi:hypothetical protein
VPAQEPVLNEGSITSMGFGVPRYAETPTTSGLPVNVAPDIVDQGLVTLELAQLLLNRFRGDAAQHFPFVVVPSGVALGTLRRTAPSLFLAIVATMIFDNPLLQNQLGEEFRQQAFQKAMLGAEKSFDILQGLLIYTAWYCHFYRRDKQQVFPSIRPKTSQPSTLLLHQTLILLAKSRLGFEEST